MCVNCQSRPFECIIVMLRGLFSNFQILLVLALKIFLFNIMFYLEMNVLPKEGVLFIFKFIYYIEGTNCKFIISWPQDKNVVQMSTLCHRNFYCVLCFGYTHVANYFVVHNLMSCKVKDRTVK